MIDYEAAAVLRIEYETDRALPLAQVLRIVGELQAAHTRVDQQVGISFYRTARGSFMVDLVGVALNSIELYERRHLIGKFVRHLIDVTAFAFRGFVDVKAATGPSLGAVEALIGPLISKDAKSVTVYVLKDNASLHIENNHIPPDSIFSESGALSYRQKRKDAAVVTIVGFAMDRGSSGWFLCSDRNAPGIKLDDSRRLKSGQMYQASGSYAPDNETFVIKRITELHAGPHGPGM